MFWRVRSGQRTVEGNELIRHDDAGRVAEVHVYIRPLVGIAAFAQAAGPALAARRISTRRATVIRLFTAPLGPLFRLIDLLASRLTRQ